MFIGLTRSVAMIFGSADPSASIPISVGPATCSKRSMPHIYSSRVWFSRKKLTWSIPHLPKSCRLASATNLFPGPTARCFDLYFAWHIWHLSWNIGDFCTNYLRWEIQYLWDLPPSQWTNQRQEQQFPGKMNWKVCPKWCSVSSFHNQSETWIPPRARICVAPAYLRVYNVAGWIFPVFLLMIIRVIGDRKFFIIMSEKLMWLNSLWFDGWGW